MSHENRGRAEPVSCQSCRTRKIRCDQVQPCSNCTTRGLDCHFLNPPRKRRRSYSDGGDFQALLKRVERLESSIIRQQHAGAHEKSAQPLYHADERLVPGVLADDAPEKTLKGLEQTGSVEEAAPLSPGLGYRIYTQHELESHKSVVANNEIVPFPAYSVALLLFQGYCSNLDHMCRITHIPTVKAQLETTYLRLLADQQIIPGQAALLLSLFALSAHFYRPSLDSEVARNDEEAAHLSKSLGQSALVMIDYSRRANHESIELIQACILMEFAAYHVEGLLTRGYLSAVAVCIARNLGLHRIDADESPVGNTGDPRQLIDQEVKRRIFWHLTASDCHLTFEQAVGNCGWSASGNYSIHPNHFSVNVPAACSDEELLLLPVYRNNDGENPTTMALFLERYRLAQLCREMVDRIPMDKNQLFEIPYTEIISMDQKFKAYIASLPFFFQLDPASRQRSKAIDVVHRYIPAMRYHITKAAHSRRCRLHQRFLIRYSTDLRYEYSREACLESARAVLQAHEDIIGHESNAFIEARMTIAMHYIHLAVATLVMDLCLNKAASDEQEVKADVRKALHAFEKAKGQSPLVGRFLDALRAVLKQHGVFLNEVENVHNSAVQAVSKSVYDENSGGPNDEPHYLSESDIEGALDADLESFWQYITQSEPSLDTASWDNLFASLNQRPV